MSQKVNQFYVNTEITNQQTQNILASYDETLTKPLLLNPSQYQLSINRFRLPLTGIPLTKNNIPFQQWAVSLAFQDNAGHWIYADEFVPQYNPITAHKYNYYVYTLGLLCYVVQGTVKNNVINAVNQYTTPITEGQIPVFAFNSNYLVVGFIGGSNFQILDPNALTLTQTINLNVSYTLQLLAMDNANNVYAVINNNNADYQTNSYVFSDGWDIGSTYTSSSKLMNTPNGVCYDSTHNILFVSDNNYVYSWTASGEPSQVFEYQRYLNPTALTCANNNVVVSYSLDNSPLDELFGLGTNQLFYDLYNNNNPVTPGQLTTQFALSGDYIFSCGTTSATFALPYPFVSGSDWAPVNNAPIRAIASYQTNFGVLGVTVSSNELVALNIHSSNNTWTTISNEFRVNNNSSVILSMDFDANKNLYAVGANNLLYKSSIPVFERYYILSDSATTSTFWGSSHKSDGTFDTLAIQTGLAFNGSLSSQNGNPIMGYLAGNFYAIVSNSGVMAIGKYDLQFKLISTLNCTECAGNILYMRTLTNTNYLYVCDASYAIHIYDTSGAQQSVLTPSPGQYNDICCPDPLGFHVICLDSVNSTYYTYDITTITAPALTGNFSAKTVTEFQISANAQFDEIGAMYSLNSSGVVICYDFTDNTYLTSSFHATSLGTTAYNSIYANETTDEVILFKNNSTDIYIRDPNNTLALIQFGTQPIEPVGAYNYYALEYLYYGILRWDAVSTNKNIESVAVSRKTPGLLFAIDTTGNVQSGQLSGNLVNFSTLGFSNTYNQISTTLGTADIPAGTPQYQISLFNTSLTYQNSFTIPALPSLLSSDANNNIVVFDGNNSTTYYPTGSVYGQQSISGIGNQINGFGYSPITLIDSGKYDLYTYQDYLNQMNTALLTAFTTLKLNSEYTSNSCPYFVYDAGNKLFGTVCGGEYITTLETPAKYKIYVNNLMWNMFLFPSNGETTSHTGFKSILVENKGNNVSQSFSSNASVVITNQEASTIAKFYDLVRILVQTKRLPVHGDNEAGINNSILLVTDVVPDTSTISPAGLLIYQPTVLRWYPLYGNNPLNNIDVYFGYGTKDGTIYPIYLTPGEYASVKLEFQEYG